MEWLGHFASAATIVSIVYLMFRGFKGDMDKRFDTIMTELKEIRHDITGMQVQIGKLETRVEERTLKVIHTQRNEVPVYDPSQANSASEYRERKREDDQKKRAQ